MRKEGAQQIAEYLGNTFYDFCKMKDKCKYRQITKFENEKVIDNNVD